MNNETQWVQPTPLRGNRSNLIDFPVNALPPILREMAFAISRTTLSDVSMAATSILSSVSYCFSGQFRIVGKKGHSEPLVIDSLIVAEASFKKSPVMKLVAKPYQDYVQEYNEKNKALILEHQAKKKVIANKLAALEKKADADTKEMSDLAMELSSITNADFRRIIVDDITPESLVRQLAINGTLLMMSDEAGSLGNFNGRYSANGAPNLDLLLKSWNGETFISDRITRESVILYKPYVSICLACQPYIWDSMIGNMAFRGSGFLARLVYCFPKDLRGTRKYNTEPIPDELSERYQKLIYALLNYKFQRFELHQADEKLLFLDEKAKDEYVFLHDQFVEKQLVTDMAFCADWGGKFHGLVLRICGILHCIKTVLNGEKPDEVKVSHDTMCNAIEIGHYFRLQAIYAYGLGDTDNQTLQAERIVAKIRSKNITQIRQNDLYKLCRCKLILGGVEIPFSLGLLGHSDADVLLHAVADALLGALALGDIGKHFPDNDPQYAGADSMVLLRHVVGLIQKEGYQVGNLDATILCQKPKLADYILQMRENIADCCGVPVSAVSVKATTEEKLGFTGAGQGIAVHAVALLERMA